MKSYILVKAEHVHVDWQNLHPAHLYSLILMMEHVPIIESNVIDLPLKEFADRMMKSCMSDTMRAHFYDGFKSALSQKGNLDEMCLVCEEERLVFIPLTVH